MYRKSSKGWLKHIDFIILDCVCLQVAFILAYIIRHGIGNPYLVPIYQYEAIALIVIEVLVVFFTEGFKGVLRRGYYREAAAMAKQVILTTLFSTFFLFMTQKGEAYSRMTLVLTAVFYFLLGYPARLLWKKLLLAGRTGMKTRRSLIIMTTSDRAEEIIQDITRNNYMGICITGLALIDKKRIGGEVAGIPVVANKETIVEYVCREWVDEIFVDFDEITKEAKKIIDAFNKMGITVHMRLSNFESTAGKKQQIQRFGRFTVLTSSVSIVTSKDLFYKRMLDIAGAIVGCILTGIMTIFVGPVIFIKSPGPIFFTQVRVGRNGKKFKIYKFRSMYMDAEERKKELMEQNRVKDGMMFKMDDDPRIIKGVGHFIRKFSIDEFPQFFNVLKGDMSLVGTRPPTVDEWERYELHHRVRLAIKPGITGLWQVSGRSSITDFEEVVKLDEKYIEEWSIGMDIKIILKTVGVVFANDGAM